MTKHNDVICISSLVFFFHWHLKLFRAFEKIGIEKHLLSLSEIQRISKDDKLYLFTKCYIHHYSSVIILRVCLKFETDRSWPGIEGEGVNFGFGQIANQFLLEIENLQCWKLSCNQVMVNLRINFNINHLFWLKVTPTEAPKKER